MSTQPSPAAQDDSEQQDVSTPNRTGRNKRDRGGHEVVMTALREGDWWTVIAPQEGVYVHARSLVSLQASAQKAIALMCEGSRPPTVRVRPQSAELDALAKERARYNRTLADAVRSLREQNVSWADIAVVCGVRIADAQAAMDQHPRRPSARARSWP
jgi:hypothetical protein